MTDTEAMNLSTIRTYLQGLQNGVIGEALARCFVESAVAAMLADRI